MSLGLNATHISSNLRNYEAARSAFFTLIIDDIDNLVKASYTGDPANAQESDRITKGQEYIQLNVTRCPVPHFSVEPLTYRRGNEVVHFAGTPTFDGGTITVDDIVGIDTKSVLMALQAQVYDVHTRKGGRMADYKHDWTLIEYTQDNVPIRSWKLYGCFIKSLSEEDFDREADGRRKISVGFSYDRAEMIMD